MNRRTLALLHDRAQGLSGDEVEALGARLRIDPTDLEARILLAQCRPFRRRQEHLLWLIENRPELPFGPAWGLMVISAGPSTEAHEKFRQAWLRVVATAAHALPVVESAGWYFLLSEPSIGETLYLKAEALNPGHAEPSRRVAEYYEHWCSLTHLRLPAEFQRDLHGRAFHAYCRAFVLEDADDRRFPLIWPMRQCAGPAGETEALRLLKLADREASVWQKSKDRPDRASHHAQVACGLVLLALNDLAAAERHLAEAAAVAVTSDPSMVLAQELLAKGRFEAVRAYLEACAGHLESGAETLRSWSAAVEAGTTPDLLTSPAKVKG